VQGLVPLLQAGIIEPTIQSFYMRTPSKRVKF
jgi:hypothetical protein